MNHSGKVQKKKNRYLNQLLLVSTLIAFPIIMLFYNGSNALNGILWGGRKQKLQETNP